MIYAVWNGGNGSYTPGTLIDDLEKFATIADAKDALLDRWRNGGWCRMDFNYVHKPADSALCPAVGDDSSMDLYRGVPGISGAVDLDWSHRISIGPRGGVKVERF